MPAEENPIISVIIPSLNEEKHIALLLNSLKDQRTITYEVFVIDGGSTDKTAEIAHQYDATVAIIPGCGEFPSRNVGARLARGKFLFFTCADTILSDELLLNVVGKFDERPELIALTGPGYPMDASLFGKLEYLIYNVIRFGFASLPKSLKRFSTSTNFLVVRKKIFSKIGGFDVDEINADGIIGRKLLKMGEVAFFPDTYVYISARRMENMGFFGFNKHYLYIFENLFFFLSKTRIMKTLKLRSMMKHRKIHEN